MRTSDGHFVAGRLRDAALPRPLGMPAIDRRVGLSGCAALHTLKLNGCGGLTDVSALAGCASLHTLDLTGAGNVTDLPLSRCATLHTVIAWNCTGLTDVSGLASCAALRVLSLVGCRTDLSGLSAIRGGPGFASLALYT